MVNHIVFVKSNANRLYPLLIECYIVKGASVAGPFHKIYNINGEIKKQFPLLI